MSHVTSWIAGHTTAICIAVCVALALATEAYKRVTPAAWQAAHPTITHAVAAVRAAVPNPIGLGLQAAAAIAGKQAMPAFLIAQAEAYAAAWNTTPDVGALKIAGAVARSVAPAPGSDPPLPRLSAPSLPHLDGYDETTPLEAPRSSPSITLDPVVTPKDPR